jgi:hypothetical protein
VCSKRRRTVLVKGIEQDWVAPRGYGALQEGSEGTQSVTGTRWAFSIVSQLVGAKEQE